MNNVFVFEWIDYNASFSFWFYWWYWWYIGGINGGNLVFLSDVFVILQNVFETNISVIGLVPYHLESYYWPPTFLVSFTSLILLRRGVRGEGDVLALLPASLKAGCHDLAAA